MSHVKKKRSITFRCTADEYSDLQLLAELNNDCTPSEMLRHLVRLAADIRIRRTLPWLGPTCLPCPSCGHEEGILQRLRDEWAKLLEHYSKYDGPRRCPPRPTPRGRQGDEGLLTGKQANDMLNSLAKHWRWQEHLSDE